MSKGRALPWAGRPPGPVPPCAWRPVITATPQAVTGAHCTTGKHAWRRHEAGTGLSASGGAFLIPEPVVPPRRSLCTRVPGSAPSLPCSPGLAHNFSEPPLPLSERQGCHRDENQTKTRLCVQPPTSRYRGPNWGILMLTSTPLATAHLIKKGSEAQRRGPSCPDHREVRVKAGKGAVETLCRMHSQLPPRSPHCCSHLVLLGSFQISPHAGWSLSPSPLALSTCLI